MDIFKKRELEVGDYVRFKGRGGCERSRKNIWKITKFLDIEGYPAAEVCLIKGRIYDRNNHDRGPGYVRTYLLENLKHWLV